MKARRREDGDIKLLSSMAFFPRYLFTNPEPGVLLFLVFLARS